MFQPNLFKGRAIFISGGGSGLGRSMALKFAELGSQIFIIGRREQPLKDVCEEIRRAGGSAGYATADVREPAAVESAVAAAFQQFGRIDTLVNNAAGNFMARTETLSANAFSAVVGIVLNGSFNCTQALAKHWIADKQGGNILNIVSTYAAANSGSGSQAPLSAAMKVASSAAYGIMSRSLIGARYGRSRRIFSVNLVITSSAAIVSSLAPDPR